MSGDKLAADYDPDWPGITTLLAGHYGHMQPASVRFRHADGVIRSAFGTSQNSSPIISHHIVL